MHTVGQHKQRITTYLMKQRREMSVMWSFYAPVNQMLVKRKRQVPTLYLGSRRWYNLANKPMRQCVADIINVTDTLELSMSSV